MKIQSFFRIVFASLLLVLLSACVTTPRSGPAALTGTWTNSLGTVWTMKSDGTFDVVNPKRHIWGNVRVSGDTDTIQETGGKAAKGCRGPGVYKFACWKEKILRLRLFTVAGRSGSKT